MISPPRPDGPILRYGKPYAVIAKLADDIRRLYRRWTVCARMGSRRQSIIAHS